MKRSWLLARSNPFPMSGQQEKRDEQIIRRLQKVFRNHGIIVRRENLSRGPSFRVRSGDCLFTGERLVFIDRRLPADQQLSTLIDYIVSSDLKLSEEDLDSLPQGTRALLLSEHRSGL